MRLILASGSPRRAELLRAAGFTFDVLACDVDETVLTGESPDAYVRRVAMAKSARAQEILRRRSPDLKVGPTYPSPDLKVGPTYPSPDLKVGPTYPSPDLKVGPTPESADPNVGFTHDVVILAADTAVVLDGVILGKPGDATEARAMVEALSGRRHDVLTGISLRRGETEVGGVEHSGVYFNEIGSDEVDWFVQSREGADKAGGYAIQGLASRFIWRLEGSYSNVVGLPVATVHELLRDEFGWARPT